MRYLLILACLPLLALACNRKTNQAVTAAAPTTAPRVVNKSEQFDPRQTSDVAAAPMQNVPDAEDAVGSRGARRAVAAQKAAAAAEAPTVVAEIRKTSCYGDCPVFRFQIMSDYSLRYVGQENVVLIGSFTGTLSFNPMLKLGGMAAGANFYRLEDNYPVKWEESPADLPYTETTINWRGRKHTVKHKYDGPEALKEIEDYLIDLVDQATWVAVDAE